jgi:hypothetical protein
MKRVIELSAVAACILFSVSCASTGLTGSLPIPFTDPAEDVQAVVSVRPIPPKVCIGLDIIDRPPKYEELKVLDEVVIIAEEQD